jgi:DNA-binding XRE family transcriptional regulator
MDRNQLKTWRITNGLTQAEAASILGVSQEMVSEMESGAKAIPASIAGKTAGTVKK